MKHPLQPEEPSQTRHHTDLPALLLADLPLSHLVDAVPDSLLIVDRHGKIVLSNGQTENLFGYSREELVGEPIEILLPESLRSTHVGHRQKYVDDPYVRPMGTGPDLWARRKDGSEFPVESSLSPLQIGENTFVVNCLRDVTHRKEKERQLKVKDAAIASSINAIGITDLQGQLIYVNDSLVKMWGYDHADEVLGRMLPEFWEGDGIHKTVAALLETGAARGEDVGKKRDGSLFHVDFAASMIKDESGKPLYMVGSFVDATERKQAEESVEKEQQLLRQLVDMHERELRLMAFEIHDGLAQQLAGALMAFEACGRPQDSATNEAGGDFEKGVKLLRDSIHETRRLISGLRPPILDDMGVVAAIDHLVREYEEANGLKIDFRHDLQFSRLAPPLETAIFRIVQESLTNAHRHSQSKRVRLELAKQDGYIRIEIQDWGIGFDPDNSKPDRFGLQGIRERARLCGGQASIDTTPGKGTQIAVELPLLEDDVQSE